MSNSSTIKARIKNIEKTKKITRAMYLISSMKIKKVNKQFEQSKYFFDKINKTMYNTINQSDILNSFFIKKNEEQNTSKRAYIIVTGDNGLAGDYNNSIMKAVQEYVLDKENSVLMCVGYIGKNTLKNLGYNVDEKFDYFVHNPTLLRTKEMTEKIIDLYSNAKIDSVYIIYNNFISSFKYKPKLEKLLPIDIKYIKKDLEIKEEEKEIGYTIKYNPSEREVFNYIVPLYLKGIIYSILINSYTCEQSARIMAMDEATQNATKIIKKLKLSYNKERQYKITKELTELVAGIEE